ncbi:MAG: CHAD domain-containing protein [Thaumarchaeota archaeon]|nr:CHAD domain-containing protein [Nitrososphaerota archaeon]
MKKSLELNKKTFLKKFEKILDDFYQKLDEYTIDPNDENIHDIRVSIRRLEAAYRVLPKSARKQEKVRAYVKQAKELFKVNAKIRDFDIICTNMESKYQDETRDLILALKNSRIEHSKNANRLALKVSRLRRPKILKSVLKESKLEKRYLKVLDEIMLDIQKNAIIALGDEKKIDELHMLRKDFKKLRYSLEITSDKKTTLDMLKDLKNIQDMLGEIHDSDIIIDYLRNIEQKAKYSDIIEAEVLERSKKYNTFVSAFRKTPKSGNFALQFQH